MISLRFPVASELISEHVLVILKRRTRRNSNYFRTQIGVWQIFNARSGVFLFFIITIFVIPFLIISLSKKSGFTTVPI